MLSLAADDHDKSARGVAGLHGPCLICARTETAWLLVSLYGTVQRCSDDSTAISDVGIVTVTEDTAPSFEL